MDLVQFALLGVGLGAVYGLLSNGLVLIYRGSGVLNFAHGALAMAGAFTFWELHHEHGIAFWPAFVVATTATGALGALTHLVIMRRLRHATGLARLIATLGLLTLLEGIAAVRYDGGLVQMPTSLPSTPITIGDIVLPRDRPIMLAIAAAMALALHLWSSRTVLGLATSAVAENRRAAATLGWSPDLVATVTWTVGAMLAAVAGILIAPLSGLNATQLTLVMIAAFASALAASFSSFGGAMAVGVGIGMTQSVMARYVTRPGASDAVPFIVIMLILLVRGRSLPVRREVFERLPAIGRGIVRANVVVPLVLLLAGLTAWVFPTALVVAITIQLIVAIILLSVLLLTGYAGQLSLAQYGMAGVGAFISGRLVAAAGWPFAAALVAGVVGAAAVGVVVGLPALRTRGVNLAVVTLGLGFALQVMVFNNNDYTGGIAGTQVGAASLFGLDLDPIAHPDRYALACLAALVLVGLVVANVRRGGAGRALLAVRSNERAAAALGIDVVRVKLFAFGTSSSIAGLAGVLLAFQSHIVIFSNFDIFGSIGAATYAMVGGVGFVGGALAGSGLAVGAVGSWLLGHVGGLDPWLGVIGGASVILMLMQNPDGLAGAASTGHADPLTARLVRLSRRSDRWTTTVGPLVPMGTLSELASPVEPAALQVEDLGVRYGGVVALDGLSLEVRPGEIVGLIGPNGAGKTTAIDAITGFTAMTSGTVVLGRHDLRSMRVHRRAAAGLGRSFQSVELFEDLTVRENLEAAADGRGLRSLVGDLVRPARRVSPGVVAAAAGFFELDDVLDRLPRELPHGRRRLAGIARAVCARPTVLLLDEPAAGLDHHESRLLADRMRSIAETCGLGILLVEHDMSVVMRVCDRITVLEFGRTIAAGTPEEIRASDVVIDAYLGSRS